MLSEAQLRVRCTLEWMQGRLFDESVLCGQHRQFGPVGLRPPESSVPVWGDRNGVLAVWAVDKWGGCGLLVG